MTRKPHLLALVGERALVLDVDAILVVLTESVVGVHADLAGVHAGVDLLPQHLDVLAIPLGGVDARHPFREIAVLEGGCPGHGRAGGHGRTQGRERKQKPG